MNHLLNIQIKASLKAAVLTSVLAASPVNAALFVIVHDTGTDDSQTTIEVTYSIDAAGVLTETIDTWNMYNLTNSETINTTVALGSFKIANTGYTNFSANMTAPLSTGGNGKLGVAGGAGGQFGTGESISYSLDLSSLSPSHSVRISRVTLQNYSAGESLTFSNVLIGANFSLTLSGSSTNLDVTGLDWTVAGGTGPIEIGVVTTDNGEGRIGEFSFEVLNSPLASLIWDGGISTDWDTSTFNWDSGTSAYTEGALVLFDDSNAAADPVTVNLTANRTPGFVNFNNSTKDYLLTGSGIAGSTGLSKGGAAGLILSNINTYAGNTIINAGVLAVGQSGAIPSGPGKGDVVLAGTFDLNGVSETINGLTGAGVVDNTAAGTASLTAGSDNDTSTFDGSVQDTGGALSLVKAGSGLLTLTGSSSHSGTTTVQAGELHLADPGSFSTASSIVVENGATLSVGSGGNPLDVPGLTLNGGVLAVDYGFLGFVAPTGAIVNTGALELSGASTLEVSGIGFGIGSYTLIDFTTQTGSGSLNVTLPVGITGQMETNGSRIVINVIDAPVPPLGYRPNFVIIIADDMNWRDCGPYLGMEGGITNTTMTNMTPNIDSLASQGMTFNYTFTPASMCSPCRGNLYSAIYPVRSGAHGNHTEFKDGIKTIVHHLRELGYKITLEGKKHVGPSSSYPWDASVDFSADEPFCYIFGSHNPHSPWTEGTPPFSTQQEIDAITFPPDYVNTGVMRTNYNNYLGEIGAFDDEVGGLMADIETAGKTSNTVFIMVTEQGGSFPGGKWTCYDLGIRAGCVIRWPDAVPANVRTDAMIEYTDILPTLIEAAGGSLPSGSDRLDGRSFLDVLLKNKPAHREYVYALHTAQHNGSPPGGYAVRAIRSRRYKFIWNLQHLTTFSNAATSGQNWDSWLAAAATNAQADFLVTRYTNRPEFEFYDLTTDPYELSNLYGEPEHAARIAEMKALLEQWMAYQSEQFVDDPAHLRYPAGPLVKDQGIWSEQNVVTNRLIPEVEPIEVWANLHGLAGADRNPTADTDGDGLTQLAEWATGRDPNTADTYEVAFATPTFGSNHVDLVFERLLMHDNYHIDYGIQARSNLMEGAWTEVGGTVLEWPAPQPGELVEKATVRVPLNGDTNQFYRLQIQTPFL